MDAMRRVLPVAMLSALLAVMPAALAQRGAGHAGSGGFRGGSSGFHGGFSGYSGFSAPRSFGQFAGSSPRVYGAAPHAFAGATRYGMTAGRLPVYRPAYRPAYRSGAVAQRRGGVRGAHDRDRYRRGYRGSAYPYGYANSWEVVPWNIGYSDFSGNDEDVSASQPASETDTEPEPEAPENSYRADYAPAPAVAAAPIAPEPQLTLIFQDGHTQQVRNYALTQDALLDLDQADSGRVARIPLASLNLPATEKAAQQAGLDFTPPAS
ncbi:MAG: hypothetical protein WCA44_11760 [Acidobacteriaceae bacterium]